MNFGKLFSQIGQTVVQAAAQTHMRRRSSGGGGGGKGPECTPCAAEAYVNGLREKPAKKNRRK